MPGITVEEGVEMARADINAVLRKARLGDVNAVTLLAHVWERLMPEITPKDALLAFLPHFRAASIPPKSSRRSSDLRLMVLAEQALSGVAPHAFYVRRDPSILPLLIRIWPDIFAWCQHIFAVGVVAPDVEEDGVSYGMKSLAFLLSEWTKNDDLRPIMADTPGCVELAAHLWAREELLPDECPPICSLTLRCLLLTGSISTFDRFYSRVGGRGSAKSIAKRARRRLRTEMKAPAKTLEFERLTAHVDCINAMSCDPDLRDIFLRINMVPTMTRLLVLVSRALGSGDEEGVPEAQLNCMISCLLYIAHSLPDPSGLTWAYQSVQHGLLSAFVTCSAYFDLLLPDIRTHFLSIITHYLPQNLIYRSLVTLVGVAFHEIVREGKWDTVDGTMVEEEWKAFRIMAAQRLEIVLRLRHNARHQYPCGNVKCDKTDSGDTFLKCSGCLSVTYCSAECQLVDWKAGHRAACLLQRSERPSGSLPPISPSDLDFIRFLTSRFLRDASSTSPEFAARSFANAPRPDQALIVDWTVSPPLCALEVICIAGWETGKLTEKYWIPKEGEDAQWEAALEEYRACTEKLDLVVVRVPMGCLKGALVLVLQNRVGTSARVEWWERKLERERRKKAEGERREKEIEREAKDPELDLDDETPDEEYKSSLAETIFASLKEERGLRRTQAKPNAEVEAERAEESDDYETIDGPADSLVTHFTDIRLFSDVGRS